MPLDWEQFSAQLGDFTNPDGTRRSATWKEVFNRIWPQAGARNENIVTIAFLIAKRNQVIRVHWQYGTLCPEPFTVHQLLMHICLSKLRYDSSKIFHHSLDSANK